YSTTRVKKSSLRGSTEIAPRRATGLRPPCLPWGTIRGRRYIPREGSVTVRGFAAWRHIIAVRSSRLPCADTHSEKKLTVKEEAITIERLPPAVQSISHSSFSAHSIGVSMRAVFHMSLVPRHID